MYDDTGYIYVYLDIAHTYQPGDIVEVSGPTSEFGAAVQFGNTVVVTKTGETTAPSPQTPMVLSGSEIDTYFNTFEVGDYVEVIGTLSISGSYLNLAIDGTSRVGSIQSDGSIDFTTYNGQEITIRGYTLYFSGSTNTYFNILVTEVVEEQTEDYDDIADIKTGTIGSDYLAEGTVASITPKGFLMYDDTGYIYVYLDIAHTYQPGDIVEVSGPTSEFGAAVQFGNTVVVTKTGETTAPSPQTPMVLSGSEIDTYFNTFEVGDYVEVIGTLSISGSYLNLAIDGTSRVGSIQSDGSIDFTTYNGQEITIRGYTLYFSGSTNTYFNILVTEVVEVIQTNTFELTILEVNDLHGYIEQDDDGTGGISNMAYLIEQIRNENQLDDVILIGNGDMFQGTAISNMTEGLSVIECMNYMDFDVMGIGNHEYDWGIDTILSYFDGNEANGEADFPLLNANIYLVADNSLLTISGGNVFEFTIIEREGVQVGIISYVGDICTSISGELTGDHYFDLDIAGSVQTIASDLKSSGVDFIVVNIHGGDASNIASYNYNVQLAQLTDTNGEYLVDIVINGHTHSYQTGSIARSNGTPLLLVQAGGKGNAFGEIVLTIDLDDMSIDDYEMNLVYTSSAGTNHDV